MASPPVASSPRCLHGARRELAEVVRDDKCGNPERGCEHPAYYVGDPEAVRQ